MLEERSPVERLQKALLLVTKERELTQVQAEIKNQVEAKMSKTQRDYFLNEQLKSIKKELGLEKDDKEALLQKFRDRMQHAVGLPEKARKVKKLHSHSKVRVRVLLKSIKRTPAHLRQ